jgi:hypothetical protein
MLTWNRGYDRSRTVDNFVMPGLVPGIHVFTTTLQNKTSMAGTSPAMTIILVFRRRNRDDAVRPEQLFETAPIRQHIAIHPSIMVRVAGNLFRAMARHEL